MSLLFSPDRDDEVPTPEYQVSAPAPEHQVHAPISELPCDLLSHLLSRLVRYRSVSK
jgi:hypothetical protein